MQTILLSIGSNIYSKNNIDKARRMLTHCFPDISFTESVMSEPYDEKYLFPFRNILGVFQSELSPEEVISKLKLVEHAMGRSPKDKALGKVIIDIDLIKYGDEVLRPQDFERDYVQHLLQAL